MKKVSKMMQMTLFTLVTSLALVACAGGEGEKKKIHDLEGFRGLKISAQSGTQGEEIAVEYSGKEKTIGFAKYVDAITALKQKKVDATFMDGLPAEQILKSNPELMIFPEALREEEYAIAVKKGNTELKAAIDAVIQELQQNGKMDEAVKAFQENEEEASKNWLEEQAQGDGEIILGTEAGFAPYETKIGDRIVGADVFLGEQIAKKLGKKLKVVDMDFDALLAAVNSGKVDFVAAGMSVTEERSQQVDFSLPYYKAKQVAVFRAEDAELQK